MNTKINFIVLSVVTVLVIVAMSIFTVDQRQYALVFQLGEVKRVITEPGLNFKIPMIQNVRFFDNRFVDQDSGPELKQSRQFNEQLGERSVVIQLDVETINEVMPRCVMSRLLLSFQGQDVPSRGYDRRLEAQCPSGVFQGKRTERKGPPGGFSRDRDRRYGQSFFAARHYEI